MVEGPDERLSFVAVGTIYDNVADVWCDLERLEGEFQSDGSGIGCSRSDMESEDVSRWGRFDGDLVGVARPHGLGDGHGDVSVETEEQ